MVKRRRARHLLDGGLVSLDNALSKCHLFSVQREAQGLPNYGAQVTDGRCRPVVLQGLAQLIFNALQIMFALRLLGKLDPLIGPTPPQFLLQLDKGGCRVQ